MQKISAHELKKRLGAHEDFTLLDVRLPFEVGYTKIEGSINIPLKQLEARSSELDKSREVVVYCHSGGRSSYATEVLLKKGFNAKNLTGGILAYSEVDEKIKKY